MLAGCSDSEVAVVGVAEAQSNDGYLRGVDPTLRGRFGSRCIEPLVDNGVPVDERGTREMRILVINDDGYDAPGIQQLFTQLEEEGYDVWMVAPIENQSGIGTAIRITGESRELVDHGGQKFAFDGTPTDAFKVAINVVMPEKPDLVISGVNDGPNFGEAHTNSGTVGGAARAVRHGYPAIASSLNHLGPPPEGETPETIIVPAVDFTVRLVNILNDEWKAGRMLMPLGTGLSLNYPFETPPGLAFVANEEPIYTDFQNFKVSDEDGLIYQTIRFDRIATVDPESDIGLGLAGWATITTIDANWNASATKDEHMQCVLADLEPGSSSTEHRARRCRTAGH
jgi:5'-nucleotidase